MSFVLQPQGSGATRLLIRVRANFQPQPLGRLLSWLALEPVHSLMENKMLKGIQRRAEANRSNPLLLDEFLLAMISMKYTAWSWRPLRSRFTWP